MIRPSTPAALAAAVRRRAIDWPLMPPSTWAVPSGRNPDRCTVSRSRNWPCRAGGALAAVPLECYARQRSLATAPRCVIYWPP